MKLRYRVEEWNGGKMERLSELESENLMSRLWEGLWERVIVEEWSEDQEVILQ